MEKITIVLALSTSILQPKGTSFLFSLRSGQLCGFRNIPSWSLSFPPFRVAMFSFGECIFPYFGGIIKAMREDKSCIQFLI